MPRLMLGTAYLLALALLSSCRKDPPPPTDICQGDGFGGANCTLSSGEHVYKTPSELENSWIIPDQKQAENLMRWCFNP